MTKQQQEIVNMLDQYEREVKAKIRREEEETVWGRQARAWGSESDIKNTDSNMEREN